MKESTAKMKTLLKDMLERKNLTTVQLTLRDFDIHELLEYVMYETVYNTEETIRHSLENYILFDLQFRERDGSMVEINDYEDFAKFVNTIKIEAFEEQLRKVFSRLSAEDSNDYARRYWEEYRRTNEKGNAVKEVFYGYLMDR